MNKIVYGLIWYFMQLPWPVRFLAELAVYVAGIVLLVRLANKLGNKLSLKKQVGKLYVVVASTIVAAVGRNRSWGKSLDDKIIESGERFDKEPMDFRPMSHKIVWVLIVICYLFAVMPDMSVFENFDGKVAECFLDTKAFFAQKESQWAGDYQLYAPSVESPANGEVMKGNPDSAKKEIEVKINERGSKEGVSIYQKPTEKAKIVLKFHGKGKTIYKNKWKKGKKGYWVKVYVPSKKVSGWMKHSYIQKSIWKKIKGR